jgi:hypothetical protein
VGDSGDDAEAGVSHAKRQPARSNTRLVMKFFLPVSFGRFKIKPAYASMTTLVFGRE